MANVTKKNVLQALATFNFTDEITLEDGVVVTPEDITEFIQTSITQIENRAVKAAEKAAEKKAEGDELRGRIKNLLNDNGVMSIPQIVEVLDDEDVTSAKVVSRLGQLVKLGEAFKADQKVDGGRTIKVYSVSPFTED